VDVDTIACEECGARLLFSTPASWNHHQGMALFFSKQFTKMLNYMNFLTRMVLHSGEGSLGLQLKIG
jgi:hypothetical protein